MERVTVRVVSGHKAPRKFFIAPRGRSLNNQGYVMGAAAGYDSATMYIEEAEVLTKPTAKAVGVDGKPLADGAGAAIKNRSLAVYQVGGEVADEMKFEIVGQEQVAQGDVESKKQEVTSG